MRIISKKISYEEFQSRIPGMIPSLTDYWRISSLYENCSTREVNNVKMYDHDAAIKLINQYNIPESDLYYGAEFVSYDIETLKTFENGNYGYIPSDIIIPKNIASGITDYTDLYVNIYKDRDKGEFYDLSDEASAYHYEFINGRYEIVYNGEIVKIITHRTFTKWWRFFNEYHHLLFNPGENKYFSSAVEVYEYHNNVIIAAERQKYVDMDELYKSRGGDAMYEWACKNCVIKFNIPKKFSNEWKNSYLYYTEALKQYAWFSDRYQLYMDMSPEDCKDADNCCDCSEYMRLGGNEFYKILSEWIYNVESTYMANVNSGYFTNSASFTIPITLQTSIDDLGQMSIFSSEWIAGEDYTKGTVFHQPYSADTNGNIQYLDDFFYMNNDGTTYLLDDCTKDINFVGNDSTSNYSDYYILSHRNEFEGRDENGAFVVTYSYSPINGKIVYNPTPDDMTVKYDLERGNFIVINSTKHMIVDGQFVTLCDVLGDRSIADVNFINGEKLPIYTEGTLKYCVYNGRRYFVERNKENEEIIRFFKDVKCSVDNGCPVSSGKYIIYGEKIHFVNNNDYVSFVNDELFEQKYDILRGSFEVDGRTYYINAKNNVVLPKIAESTYNESNDVIGIYYSYAELTENDLAELGWKKLPKVSDNSITIYYDYTEIGVRYVSGYSESKLELLRRTQVDTDDLGNELPGYVVPNMYRNYNTAYDGVTLDILYEEGTVSELERISNDTFFGNYLEKITLFYSDGYNVAFDDKNDPLEVEITKGKNITDAVNELNANIEDPSGLELMLYVEYYIGCTLKSTGVGKYEKLDTGVKYSDTLKVEKKVGTYYTNDGGTFLFNYYALLPFLNVTENSALRTKMTTMESMFEMQRPLFVNGNFVYQESEPAIYNIAKYNNMVVAPLMRREWDLFSSTPQILNRDIYIDRGINAAFEKHLKLQEVRTMEALENYGINYFKIQNY